MAWDNVWESIFQTRTWGKYPTLELVRFIARNFFSSPNRAEVKVLEIGCGPGANLWFMAREGLTVYGLDASPTALAKAKAYLDSEIPEWRGELLKGDFVNLPFENDFFDAVIDVEAICTNSFDDAKKIFANIHRVLKIGGKMFSTAFATGCYGDGSGKEVGYRAYEVAEGPLLGEGYNRFTDAWDLKELLGELKLLNLEMVTRTVENMKFEVREFLISAEKV